MSHDPSQTEITDALRAPDAATSRRLLGWGVIAVGSAIIWFVQKSPLTDFLLQSIGALTIGLGALPALNWARQGAVHFPIFEVLMLMTIPFYGVSLLAGHPDVLAFNEDATLRAAGAVVLFQVCAIVAFNGTAKPRRNHPLLRANLLPASAFRYAQAGLWLNTGYIYVNDFTDTIPSEIKLPLRAVFFGLGTVSLFIEMRRWGGGSLGLGEKFVVAGNLMLQTVLLFRGLYLIVGISILMVAMLAYVSTSRRIPLVIIALLLPIIAVLHSGKSKMRFQHWEQGERLPDLTEMPAFFERWIDFGLQGSGEGSEPASTSLTGRLFERASLFQMLCLVTERTPDPLPHLTGESYIYIPAQLIPRFFWPGKPSSLTSNTLLAIYYKLIPEDGESRVSIAFGMIAEAYANFGFLGCAVLGLVLGYGYKLVSAAAVGCPQFSALGLLTILLGAWSFQAEQILASWLVSLVQAGAVVIGIPVALRILFPQE